LLALALVEIN